MQAKSSSQIKSSTTPPRSSSAADKAQDQVHRWLLDYSQTREPVLRDKIIQASLSLVKRIAYGLARRSTDPVEDLIQVGSIGLIKAVDQFKPDAGAKFQTYATHLITGEIRHYLRDKTAMIRAPRELQELSFRINRLVQNLTAKLGREPSDVEIAHELQIPVARVNEAYEVDRRRTLISLDQALSNDAGSEQSLIDTLVDGRYQSNQIAKEDRFMLAEAIKHLRDGLREVVQLTFYEDLSQTEVARRLGISQMQVSRRLRAATAELYKIITQAKRQQANNSSASSTTTSKGRYD
ncbi:MAG: sigma-70 family RNA polymerase sigma factor [Candidatus Obscuribacterales bacterium]|nr:sigma-70 family RNA polymerase sigma factor [Candidatus Obscuribacterales bacterium]